MEKLTNVEKEARRESARAYVNAEDKRKKELGVPQSLIDFACTYSGETSELGLKMRRELASGKYEKPSEYMKAELSGLFGTRIPEALVPSLLYEIDNAREYPFTEGWYRRTFRSDRYDIYVSKICTIVKSYTKSECDAPYPAYLTGKVSPAQMDCFYVYDKTHNEFDIAYNIDMGDEATIRYITDVINGGMPDEITYSMLRAVFMANNHELHELAGKLLLAAKLQEGLRQAICETCDMGRYDAFRYIIGIIADNDLIRYSSVKRAVGTWTGLIAEGSKDLERVSGKTLALITECLDDDNARREALATDDVMKVFLALWAEAVRSTSSAIDVMKKIAVEGTHPQVMATAYFTSELFSREYKARVAKTLVIAHPGELDVLALSLRNLFEERPMRKIIEDRGTEAILLRNFADRGEAEKLYADLKETLQQMPKKPVEFNPCVFPWNFEKITRGDVIRALIAIAAALGDEDKKDELCPLLADIDTASLSKRGEMELLVGNPKTEIQRDTAVLEIGDKETYTREAAFRIVSEMELNDKQYLMLEDMLRFKASDIREHVIGLLMKMDDERLYQCAERLISDKKEEKRAAGLDILMQIGKDENRKALFERSLPLTSLIAAPTTKEQILIDQLRADNSASEEEAAEGHGFYTSEDCYKPEIDKEYLAKCIGIFKKYFPSSEVLGEGKAKCDDSYYKVLKALDDLIEEHRNDEFTAWNGDIKLLGSTGANINIGYGAERKIAFPELWEAFYENYFAKDHVLLFRTNYAMVGWKMEPAERERFGETVYKMFGREFATLPTIAHHLQVSDVLSYLLMSRFDKTEYHRIAFAAMYGILGLAETTKFFIPVPAETRYKTTRYYVDNGEICSVEGSVSSLLADPRMSLMKSWALRFGKEEFPSVFALSHMFCERLGTFAFGGKGAQYGSYYTVRFEDLSEAYYIRAAYEGIITEGYLYRHFFEECESLNGPVETLCGIVRRYHESEDGRKHYYWGRESGALLRLLGQDKPEITDENRPLVEFAAGIYEKLIGLILDSELRRGDSPAEFTQQIKGISRIFGADRFVQILSALGRDTLDRASWYGNDMPKRRSLSHLLSVCVPRAEDTAETLRAKLKGTDITDKRLVEAALYSEGWIPVVGEYLGWEGFESACYYFISHMNERFSEQQKALFAKYTPITTDELNDGAFDIDWFRETLDTIGEKRFDMIYDAAKYITDGAKHTRARKYADAVRGKLSLDEAEKQIHEKRNKDTLMASALIPLSGDADVLYRYKLYMQFRKESSKFGQQRKASEGTAVDMALRNLAENSGFTDVTRLTMRMETMMFDDVRQLTEPQALDDITLRLVIDEQGKCEVECMKGGKELKSIPAKYKKDELVVTLAEMKKTLTEQYRRTRLMFEQAMEDMTEFTAGELEALMANPVVAPIVKGLVYTDGKGSGMLEGTALVAVNGKTRKLAADTPVRVAHPYDLYAEGSWRDWQKLLFERQLVQPYRQVFRELYVKTGDELGTFTSLRYAGNQIQPQKTVGCLKSRRWVADVEDGLQKVYYKHDVIARIYALADWFSPADIEAPTLEWVDFFERKTGKQMKIDDIPDIIFSEVMRDVDLAVSVAHAGGVDPEASHSTVELRRAVCEFTLPLFGLTNVTFEKNHALITGGLADYSVHLGSGVVHIQGGPMINVLPVHSQHRGRLFLPFVDDDPKTAQIISEILLFAEDKKIADPFILQQIKR
ncbi:MAG: DUF4132 domain-containing protein [Lachnospiraceae bacterium]|nr:DUF4132 domain-containing protein [Lachnospiraceae bacterium]